MKKKNIDDFIFQDIIIEEGEEFIPILSPEEEEKNNNEELPDLVAILPVRNTVLFPGVVIPITVGRQKSIKLVKEAYAGDKIIGVVAQKNSKSEDPGVNDLHSVGTIAKIIKMLVLPDGNTTIIIQGKRRFKLTDMVQIEPYFKGKATFFDEIVLEKKNKQVKAITSSLKDMANKVLKLNPEIPQEAEIALNNIESAGFLAHFLSSNLNVDVAEKQRLLEIEPWSERTSLLLEHLNNEIQLLEIKRDIHKKVNTDIDAQQRDYFLRHQMKVLQDELGQEGSDKEIQALKLKGEKRKWGKEIKEHFLKEVDKLLRLNPQSAEFPVAMNYVQLLYDLPWDKVTKDKFDLKKAKIILDKGHSGLDKVKDRVIEYLAVLKLKNNMKAPIICLYGPPGVGKTSLGKSIAKSLGREYVRMSLGGVHDEAEIRGHRKTYIGAMPGKVIQNIKKAKSSNPVFVLDEIDKIGTDFKGDPSSALLEVLDPEQNSTFQDNYLEVEYDLSKVLFIATANSLNTIQPALRDRMEIIEVNGYSLEEKVEIAKNHLVPRQREENGLKAKDVSITIPAITKVIDAYTRESGVRNLERKLGKLMRNTAKSIALEEEYSKSIKPVEVRSILGPEIFESDEYQDNDHAGVAVGLAWTSVGGDILFIESSLSKGKGKITLSGQLGDVMKESAMTALSYLKAHSEQIGINIKVFDNYDLHLHFPEGATPKDGPSAGITILTALTSLYTQQKVKARLAMTGEITLRGKVLPVGGIKEKILAAKRAGIVEIIMCYKNEKDIEEINPKYIEGLKINFVKTVDDVLKIALMDEKVKNPIKFIIDSDKKENLKSN